MMSRPGTSKEAADRQIANEDTAKKRLRSGAEDYRGTELLKLDREHIAAGNFTNKDQLLDIIDKRMPAVAAKELAGMAGKMPMGQQFIAVLKVGQDVIAKATAEAPVQRTRPGGM